MRIAALQLGRVAGFAFVICAATVAAIAIGPATSALAQAPDPPSENTSPDTPAPDAPAPEGEPESGPKRMELPEGATGHRRPDAATRPALPTGEEGAAEDEDSLLSDVWDIAEEFYDPGFAIRFDYLIGRMRVVVVSGDETGDTGRIDVTDKFDSRETQVFGFNMQAQNFSLGVWQQKITGRAILEDDITLDDVDFFVGEDVNGSFVVNFLSADWVVGTAGVGGGSGKVEATIGFKLLVMQGELESNTTPGKVGAEDIPVTPPNAGVRLRWSFGPIIARIGIALFPELPFAVDAAGARVKGTMAFDERWVTVDAPLSDSVLIRVGYSRIQLRLDVETRNNSSGSVTKGDLNFVLEGAFFTFQWNIS